MIPAADFSPGTVLGDRYRIVSVLGRGGMGEVYRADDLMVGEVVALKFLPRHLATDPARVAQLIHEVRIGRQISHPNVCRIHDIGEVNGRHYLSMEYIDGEDLASLLRRVGRLSSDKAREIARQLCAGLAAAHAKGVLHRDLKPANVMIDGRGHARITDFGLAVISDRARAEEVAGTPAYIAPEQLAGEVASVRSDLFSLGLILYELFAGRRLYSVTTLDERRRLDQDSAATRRLLGAPTLDRLVDQVIRQCLERDPDKRPDSASSIAGTLAVDEQPTELGRESLTSPATIRDSPDIHGLRPRVAWAVLGAIIAGTLAIASGPLALRSSDLPMAPQMLAARAQQLLASIGSRGQSHRQRVLVQRAHASLLSEKIRCHSIRLSAKPFSPFAEESVPRRHGGRPTHRHSGPRHRDARFAGTTRRVQLAARSSPRRSSRWTGARLAGVVRTCGAEHHRLPSGHSRQRAGSAARLADTVEGNRGVRRDPRRRSKPGRKGGFVSSARRNRGVNSAGQRSRHRFADRRGTLLLDLGGVGVRGICRTCVDEICGWDSAIVPAHERWRCSLRAQGCCLRSSARIMCRQRWRRSRLFLAVSGWVLVWTAFCWMIYIAIEPYVRRRWPAMLMSWVRLLQGRVRDPRVGRDVLFGVLAGIVLTALDVVHGHILDRTAASVSAFAFRLEPLHSSRHFLAAIAFHLADTLQFALAGLFFFLLLRLIVANKWIASAIWVAMATAVGAAVLRTSGGILLGWSSLFAVAVVLLFLLVLFRVSFLAVALMLIVQRLLTAMPITLDPDAWFFGSSVVILLLVVGAAVYGFLVALAGRSALAESPL